METIRKQHRTANTKTDFRVLFLSGYRTKDIETYSARNSVIQACKDVSGCICDTPIYSQKKVGKHSILPPFTDMVDIAKSAVSPEIPTILIGHCIGAAVAIELAQTTPHLSLAGIIFLCPPVDIHEVALQRAQAFRIFGLSTHIPKDSFVSDAYKLARAGKAETISHAKKVFQKLSFDSLRLPSLSCLVFVSASDDLECDSRATMRLAHALGCTHIQLQDTHSIKRDRSVETLTTLLAEIKDSYLHTTDDSLGMSQRSARPLHLPQPHA